MTNPEKITQMGRPRNTPGGSKNVTCSLPVELAEDFKKFGGSKFLREAIMAEQERRKAAEGK